MPLLTVDAMAPEDLAERIVLLRIDGNDKFGLRDTLPTLSYLSEAKARAVIATHCGTPTDVPHVDELGSRPHRLGQRRSRYRVTKSARSRRLSRAGGARPGPAQ